MCRLWRQALGRHVFDALAKVHAVDAVAVSDQEARRFVIRKGFDDLLGRPARSWMSSGVELDDHAAVMSEYEINRNHRCRSTGGHCVPGLAAGYATPADLGFGGCWTNAKDSTIEGVKSLMRRLASLSVMLTLFAGSGR